MSKKLKFAKPISILITMSVLSACSVSNSRYQLSQDIAPQRPPTQAEIRDITPTALPYSRGGNRDYTVRGISYQVKKSHHNYVETGTASWYGTKFHGHLTSNGETYNMYGLSAAHKALPIPSFVKVTNLDNNLHTIVRVNDRGPFHPDRVIDLSYGAAYKLGVLKHGTARVKLEAITVDEAQSPLVAPNIDCTIQLLALKNHQVIAERLKLVKKQFHKRAYIEKVENIYRLKLGPFNNLTECETLHKKVLINYPKAFIKR